MTDSQNTLNTLKRDPFRARIEEVLESRGCEVSLALVLSFNMLLVVLETDAEGRGEEVHAWVPAALIVLLFIYTVELTFRFLAFHWKFFADPWNIMDFGVVAMDIFFLLLRAGGVETPNISVLRMCRFVKLARAYKMLAKFPELHLMMKGLAGALRSTFWGLVLVNVVLLVWSIMAVQIIHPLNEAVAQSGVYDGCDRCPRAFQSVFQSFLTFTQQIVAGDSWGTVSVPIIEQYPLAGVYFLCVLVSINLVILNLILATICDAAQAAREGTLHQVADEKAKSSKEAKDMLIHLCKDLDVDRSGRLTLPEFRAGFEENQAFQDLMQVMDIQLSDLPVVFQMLDVDKSGDVDIIEFVEELHRMKNQDTNTMLVFVRFYVNQIRQQLEEQLLMLLDDPAERVAGHVARKTAKHPQSKHSNTPLLGGQSPVTGLGPRQVSSSSDFLLADAGARQASADLTECVKIKQSEDALKQLAQSVAQMESKFDSRNNMYAPPPNPAPTDANAGFNSLSPTSIAGEFSFSNIPQFPSQTAQDSQVGQEGPPIISLPLPAKSCAEAKGIASICNMTPPEAPRPTPSMGGGM